MRVKKKPEEAYAQQRIEEIGTILAQLSASQKAYEDAVARADAAVIEGNRKFSAAGSRNRTELVFTGGIFAAVLEFSHNLPVLSL